MMTKEELETTLFSRRMLVYSVIDGAAIPEFRMKAFEMRPPNYCLIPGELTPDMEEVAPYVVQLIPGTPFTDWLLSDFLGKNKGIFVHCPQSIKEMRRHFRALFKVYTENGDPLIFRFYDPRVFRRFLPTCNTGELKTFFGNVDTFFVEGENGDLEKYDINNEQLRRKKVGTKE